MKFFFVSGQYSDPLFVWLRQNQISSSSIETVEPIKFNYTKFLIDRHGILFRVYSPFVEPLQMEDHIKALLA